MEHDDIKDVLAVEQASFSEPWSEEMFNATLLLPYAHYYVAEIKIPGDVDAAEAGLTGGGFRIIGECGVRDIMGEGEITNVAILPAFRGQGFARQMFDYVIRDCMEKGVKVFTLEVRESNRAAIALYERFGFRTEGVRKAFYRDPDENALIMWRR